EGFGSTRRYGGVDLSPGPSPKRGGVTCHHGASRAPERSAELTPDGIEYRLPLPASGRGLGGEVNPLCGEQNPHAPAAPAGDRRATRTSRRNAHETATGGPD